MRNRRDGKERSLLQESQIGNGNTLVIAIISLIVSALALLVSAASNWSRIRALFRPAQISITVQQRWSVQQWWGRPYISFSMDLHNTGGSSTTISTMELALKRDSKVWKLSQETYFSEDLAGRIAQMLGQHQELLIGPVTLRPDEHWRGTIVAYDYPGESEEKRLNELWSDMAREVADKRKGLAPDAPSWK